MCPLQCLCKIQPVVNVLYHALFSCRILLNRFSSRPAAIDTESRANALPAPCVSGGCCAVPSGSVCGRGGAWPVPTPRPRWGSPGPGQRGFSIAAKGKSGNSLPYLNRFKKMKPVPSPSLSSILLLNVRIFILLIHRLSKYGEVHINQHCRCHKMNMNVVFGTFLKERMCV